MSQSHVLRATTRSVDLGESFPTNIFLQNSVSIQQRTSPVKFAASRDKFPQQLYGGISDPPGGQREVRDRTSRTTVRTFLRRGKADELRRRMVI